MSKLTERIVGVLVGLFLLSYVLYQAFHYFNNPIVTETIYEYTVSRSISARGVAVRDESVLPQAITGSEYYPLEDASRVAIGETVVEVGAGSRVASSNVKRIRELEAEIQQLEEAQNTVMDYSNTELYNRDIKQRVSRLAGMASTGRYEDIADMRQSLTSDMNKKQISNGKATDYTDRIRQLRSELEKAGRSAEVASGTAITAQRAAYFSKTVDGYETRLTPERLPEMTVDELVRLIDGVSTYRANDRVGKLVYSESWTFAVAVPQYHLEWINELIKSAGRRNRRPEVELEFDQLGQTIPATLQDVIEQKNSDTAVLLLKCDRMNEELINLRVAGATVHFERYTGLRINASDLRFRQNKDGVSERGVYILRNNQVYFRLVDPVYEESGFVLSKTYYSREEYLEPQRRARMTEQEDTADDPPDLSVEEQEEAAENSEGTQADGVQNVQDDYKRYVILFDQVITKGTDLYEGKTIQDN